MKNILPFVLLFGLAACSQKAPQSGKLATKHAPVSHQYSVTFAAVKIADSKLKELGLPSYEELNTPELKRKLAAYVLAHPAEFSFTTTTGNCLPIVRNNEQTHIKLLLDPKQEEKDFEAFGMSTTGFTAGVKIKEEDDNGLVYCDWFCNCGIHLKQPIGNSTGQGIGGVCGSGLIATGQPEIWRLLRGNGASIWILVALNRG